MTSARTALFLALLVSLALVTVATFEVLERVQAEPSDESVVAQQEGIRVVAEIRSSPNLGDRDGDTVPDDSDNCPAWPNATQSLPPWPVMLDGSDPDCDGWTTGAENFIGTNPNLACSADRWPPDFNSDHAVNVFDLDILKPALFSTAPNPPYQVRLDLDADGDINIFDLDRLKPFLFLFCTP